MIQSLRPPFFAMKALRLLTKSCELADLGDAACALFMLIVTTEDAARYRGPVGYWDCQIANQLGWSPDKVARVRKKLVDAGWMKYERTNSRRQGRYQALIPPSIIENIDDSPVEPNGELEDLVRMGAEYPQLKERMGADHPTVYAADHPADPTSLSLTRTHKGAEAPISRQPPSVEVVAERIKARGLDIDAEEFHAYYESQGWKKANGQSVKSWDACLTTWAKRNSNSNGKPHGALKKKSPPPIKKFGDKRNV